MLVLNCTVCGNKLKKFIKNQEESRLLSTLVIRTSVSNIPVLGDILFIKAKISYFFLL